MSSSGAQYITIENGRIAGSVRFESMRAASAFGFRLKLDFRVSLDAIPELGPYALTDLDGELSVADRPVGRLHRHGSRPDISCKPQAVDHPVVLVVDVEPWVLDRMEEQRNGGETRFRVDLSPRLEREDGRRVRAWIQTFPIPVARDDWLRILEQLGHGSCELIEVRIPADHGDHVRSAVEFFRRAQRHLLDGLWLESLQEVRFVCEALEKLLRPQTVKDFFKASIDGGRGEHWGTSFSRLKEIASSTHHLYGQNGYVLRAEARSAVRSAANLLELVSALLGQPTEPPARSGPPQA
jgi:hypothetical protein